MQHQLRSLWTTHHCKLHTVCLILKGIGNHSVNQHVWIGFTFSCWLTKPLIRIPMSVPSWFFSAWRTKQQEEAIALFLKLFPLSSSFLDSLPSTFALTGCRIRSEQLLLNLAWTCEAPVLGYLRLQLAIKQAGHRAFKMILQNNKAIMKGRDRTSQSQLQQCNEFLS